MNSKLWSSGFDVSISMDAHRDYGLSNREVVDALTQGQTALKGRRQESTRLNIPKAEQDLMANAPKCGSSFRQEIH